MTGEGYNPPYIAEKGQNKKLHNTQLNVKIYSVHLTDRPTEFADDINGKK
jgi:hypothetical protein